MFLATMQGAYVSAQSFNDKTYIDCMALADEKPSDGLNKALIWMSGTKNIPARHCEAIALMNLGEYGEAAIRLENMIEDMRVGIGMPRINGVLQAADRVMISKIIKQSADAWLLDNNTSRAFDVASQAFSLYKKDDERLYDFHILRAESMAVEQDFDFAIAEYTLALQLKENGLNALLGVAKSNRILGNFTLARNQIDSALQFHPDNPSLMLENGTLAYFEGDEALARRLWLWVATHAENTSLAKAAQKNLEQLELKSNDAAP